MLAKMNSSSLPSVDAMLLAQVAYRVYGVQFNYDLCSYTSTDTTRAVLAHRLKDSIIQYLQLEKPACLSERSDCMQETSDCGRGVRGDRDERSQCKVDIK